MDFVSFLGKHVLEIILSLVSAGALAFCKYLHNRNKKYEDLLKLKEQENVEKTIDEKIEPLIHEIEDLKDRIETIADKECADMAKITKSWRFRIIQLCQLYLEQGYLTQRQYTQLSEMYTLYHELGGNGQATEIYNKTMELPILSDNYNEE